MFQLLDPVQVQSDGGVKLVIVSCCDVLCVVGVHCRNCLIFSQYLVLASNI